MSLGLNLNAWKNKTTSAKARIRSSATSYVIKKVRQVYNDALKVSPQYSGAYTYNWAIEVTGNVPTYSPHLKVVPWQSMWERRHKMGDLPAITAALNSEKDTINRLKWNSNIKLVNPSPIHEKLEAHEIRLRPENVIAGDFSVIEYLKHKYTFVR